MSMRLAGVILRSALAVVRHHPGVLIRTILWYGLFAGAVLCGAAAVQAMRAACSLMESSAGIHVVLAPDASGLAALDQAIENLSGVHDARFVVRPLPAGQAGSFAQSTPRHVLYVRTEFVDADSLAALASAIRSFDHVEDVLYESELVKSVAGVRASFHSLVVAAWGAAALLVLAAGSGGSTLVRRFRVDAVVMSALGAPWWMTATPAGIAGGVAGALGALMAWALLGGIAAGGTTPVHEALRYVNALGPLVLGAAAGLGACSAFAGTARGLSGRPPYESTEA